MKVQPNKNISLKKGKVSVFGVLLAFHCCWHFTVAIMETFTEREEFGLDGENQEGQSDITP